MDNNETPLSAPKDKPCQWKVSYFENTQKYNL